MSIEGLAEKVERTPRWLRSIERGEIMLSRNAVSSLNVALADASKNVDLLTEDFDLERVFKELCDEPYGARATALRCYIVEPMPDVHPSIYDTSTDDLLPVLKGVSPVDRLLVLWPAVLWMALLLVGAALIVRPADVIDSLGIAPAVMAGAGVLAICVLLISPLGSLLETIVTRSSLRREGSRRSALAGLRRSYGVPTTSNLVWYQPDATDFLHPDDRPDASDAGLEAELANRTKIIFGFAAIGGLVSTIVLGLVGKHRFEWSVAAYTLAATLLWLSASLTATVAEETVIAATHDGLGRPRPTPPVEEHEASEPQKP